MNFFFTARINLFSPRMTGDIERNGNSVPLVGYYVNIGLNAESEFDARAQLKMAIEDGEIDWNELQIKKLKILTLSCKKNVQIMVFLEYGISLEKYFFRWKNRTRKNSSFVTFKNKDCHPIESILN